MPYCYRSGLEGYCNGVATLLGFAGNIDVLLGICQEILPDRARGTLSKTWTLSNRRQGPANRLSLFEMPWLGGLSATDYGRAAKLFKSGGATGALSSVEERERRRAARARAMIEGDPDFAIQLKTAVSLEEAEALGRSRGMNDAIENCVESIVEHVGLDDRKSDEPVSYITCIVGQDDFCNEFYTHVVPAMQDGFQSERFTAAEARQFTDKLSELMVRANRAVTHKERLDDYRAFLKALVAGIVYGPTCPLALGNRWDETLAYYAYNDALELAGTTIRLTQVFDETMRYSGFSEVFREDEVVLFGNCTDADDYRVRFTQHFGENRRICRAVETRRATVFPMTKQDAVSGTHAVLVCDQGSWYLYDLGSTNGTVVLSGKRLDGSIGPARLKVENLLRVCPGDTLRLGAPLDADDANVYWSAASIFVSLDIERGMDKY